MNGSVCISKIDKFYINQNMAITKQISYLCILENLQSTNTKRFNKHPMGGKMPDINPPFFM